MKANAIRLEVAADSTESAMAAASGGAHRVELFSNPLEGGVTPSYGLIAVTRWQLSIGLHILIRPRGGDFYYSQEEFSSMKRDIEMAKELGADGVAVGVLNIEGEVDVDRLAELVRLARPMQVTFHRAFDMTRDLQASLQALIDCGVDRVLTSAGEQSALKGAGRIRELVMAADDRIGIIAGGGIRPDNVRHLLRTTGVREIHAGLRSTIPSPMRYRNLQISMGSLPGREYERLVVLEDSVRQLRRETEI